MARWRALHRSTCLDPDIATMSEFAQLLWDRIIVVADDFGRLPGEPEVVRALCVPLISSRTAADVANALDQMVERELVRPYRHGRRVYIEVCHWDEYQRPAGTLGKRTTSEYPGPEDDGSQPWAYAASASPPPVADHASSRASADGADQDDSTGAPIDPAGSEKLSEGSGTFPELPGMSRPTRTRTRTRTNPSLRSGHAASAAWAEEESAPTPHASPPEPLQEHTPEDSPHALDLVPVDVAPAQDADPPPVSARDVAVACYDLLTASGWRPPDRRWVARAIGRIRQLRPEAQAQVVDAMRWAVAQGLRAHLTTWVTRASVAELVAAYRSASAPEARASPDVEPRAYATLRQFLAEGGDVP